jgi:hypothetical protein
VAVSSQSWRELREAMGRARDRDGALDVLEQAGYEPLAWQERFHLADSPADQTHKLPICGLGAGKTEAGVAEALILAMLNPSTWGIIVAPTYDQLQAVIVPRLEFWFSNLAAAGTPLLRKFHRTAMFFELWCGARIYLRSAGKIDNIRGFEFGWGWIDESEAIPNIEEVWDVVLGRIRRRCHVRQVYATSTPRGMRGCVQLFLRMREEIAAAGGGPADLAAWYTIRATSHDNPHVAPGWAEAKRKTYGNRRYREEILAEILKPQTAVWPELDAARHVIDWGFRDMHTRRDLIFDPRLPYDIAYDAGDSFPHVLWIQRTNDETCVIFDEYCEDGDPPSKLHALIVDRCDALGRAPEKAVLDRARTDEIRWMRGALPTTHVLKCDTWAEQDVQSGIRLVADRLDPVMGRPKILVSRRLVPARSRRGIWNCLREYKYKRKSDGSIGNEPWKDNTHDHGADALRMHQVKLFGTRPEVQVVRRRYA